jgi:hypothetical protein
MPDLGHLLDPGDHWSLAGAHVHCGTGLELRLPQDRWLPVRFELAWDGARMAPVLHMALGHGWERRFAPQRRDGWVLYDFKLLRVCTMEARGAEDQLLYPDLCREVWATEESAAEVARSFNEAYAGCPTVAVPWTPAMELRWPARGGAR